jgi:hypothetical protein
MQIVLYQILISKKSFNSVSFTYVCLVLFAVGPWIGQKQGDADADVVFDERGDRLHLASFVERWSPSRCTIC